MKIVFHVGPTKTGTTTLQSILNSSRSELAMSGIWYPKGRPRTLEEVEDAEQHHQIPFALCGFDPKAAYLCDASVPIEEEVAGWIKEAAENGCHTVLLSSEVMEFATCEQWELLNSFFDVIELKSEIPIEHVTLVSTHRELEDRRRSAFGQSIMMGSRLSEEQAAPLFVQQDHVFNEAISSLLARFPDRFRWTVIDFEAPGDRLVHGQHGAFPLRWFTEVLGEDVAKRIPASRFSQRQNPQLSKERLDVIAEFNRANLPVTNTDLLPLLPYAEPESERARARIRYQMFRAENRAWFALFDAYNDLKGNYEVLSGSFSSQEEHLHLRGELNSTLHRELTESLAANAQLQEQNRLLQQDIDALRSTMSWRTMKWARWLKGRVATKG